MAHNTSLRSFDIRNADSMDHQITLRQELSTRYAYIHEFGLKQQIRKQVNDEVQKIKKQKTNDSI